MGTQVKLNTGSSMIQLEREHNIICEDLGSTRFLCIIADGSNDKGLIEQEVVHVRYAKVGQAVEKFLSLQRVVNSTARYVYASIIEALATVGSLSLDQLEGKVVCLNFDGSSVM